MRAPVPLHQGHRSQWNGWQRTHSRRSRQSPRSRIADFRNKIDPKRTSGSSPLPLIVLAATLARIGVLGVRIAPAKGAEKVVPAATACDADIARGSAHRKAAL